MTPHLPSLSRRGRRILRVAGLILLGPPLLLLLTGCGLFFWLNSESGETWLAARANTALSEILAPRGIHAAVGSLSGPLPSVLRLENVTTSDKDGVWLTVKEAGVDIRWAALLSGRLEVENIRLTAPDLMRLPLLAKSAETKETDRGDPLAVLRMPAHWPGWLPAVSVRNLEVRDLTIGPAIAGEAMILSLAGTASASAEGLDATLRLERKDRPGSERVTLTAELSPDLTLSLLLDAEENREGLAVRLLPPGLAVRPLLRAKLTGEAPLEDWRGKLRVELREEGPALGQPERENALPASPPAEEAVPADAGIVLEADADMRAAVFRLPRRFGVRLTVSSGSASAGLWRLAGQQDGKLSAALALEVDQQGAPAERSPESSELRASAALTLSLTDMRWSDPRLAAVLGPTASLKTHLDADLTAHGSRLSLSGLSLKAGGLSAEGGADALLPAASADDRAFPPAVLQADLSAALTDVSLLMSPLSETADGGRGGSTHQAGGSVAARLDIAGLLAAPAVVLAVDSPDLAGGGLRARDVSLRIVSPAMNLAALGMMSDADLRAGEAAGRLSARFAPDALSPQGGDPGQVRLLADWAAARRMVDGQDNVPAWIIALTGGRLNAAGLNVSGDVRGEIGGRNGMALTGDLRADVTDWNALSIVTGQPVRGEGFALAVHLTPDGQGQTIRADWSADLLELTARPEATASRQSPLFAVRHLKGSAAASGIPSATRLEAGNRTGSLHAAGVRLGGSALAAEGLLSGPLHIRAEAQPPSGKAARAGGPAASEDLLKALSARLDATWRPGRLDVAALDISSVDVPPFGISLRKPVTLRYGVSPALPEGGFSVTDLELTAAPSGSLSLSGTLGSGRTDLRATISRLDLGALRPLIPALPEGHAEAQARLTGRPDRPSGDGNIRLTGIHIPGSSLPPFSCALTGKLEPGRAGSLLAARLDFAPSDRAALGIRDAHAEARLPLAFSADGIPALPHDGPLSARLTWDGELAPLWNLLPLADRRLIGSISLNADVSGTLRHPRVSVDGAVRNAVYEDQALGVLLRDINATATMAGPAASASPSGSGISRNSGAIRLSFRASDGMGGAVSADGTVDPAAMSVDARGTLDRLKPLRRQDLRMSLSGTASAAGPLTAPALKAALTINEGELRLAELPGGGIRTLDINDANAGNDPRRTANAGSAHVGTLDATITVPNRFFVRGHGLESEWKGDVRLAGTFTEPSATGSLNAVRGSFEFLNRNFRLDRGRISFAGGQPIDPLLDVRLVYQAPDIQAGVVIGGTGTNPTLTLESQPSLPRDEILSRIMFGQPAGSLGRMEALQLAGAAASLAGIGSGGGMGVLDRARGALGVDVLRLNSSASGDGTDQGVGGTSLEVGKYVTDRVYVGVSQGMSTDSTGVLVEVELTPRVNLEARTDNTRSEAGVQWKYDY